LIRTDAVSGTVAHCRRVRGGKYRGWGKGGEYLVFRPVDVDLRGERDAGTALVDKVRLSNELIRDGRGLDADIVELDHLIADVDFRDLFSSRSERRGRKRAERGKRGEVP
jgi:hypothetical protein